MLLKKLSLALICSLSLTSAYAAIIHTTNIHTPLYVPATLRVKLTLGIPGSNDTCNAVGPSVVTSRTLDHGGDIQFTIDGQQLSALSKNAECVSEQYDYLPTNDVANNSTIGINYNVMLDGENYVKAGPSVQSITFNRGNTIRLLNPSNDNNTPPIHITRLHVSRALPMILEVVVRMGTVTGSVCNLSGPAIPNWYVIRTADTNMTIDGQTLYNNFRAGYTCVLESYNLPGTGSSALLTYAILGNPTTYYQATPPNDHVIVS